MSCAALLTAEAFVEMFHKNLRWVYLEVFVYPPLMELDKLTRERRVSKVRDGDRERDQMSSFGCFVKFGTSLWFQIGLRSLKFWFMRDQ